ncbi:UDP-N-acetylglucosamine 4,6-dehydratase (inverting) [Candidatus Pelagibacter sp.]|nr:UDP-N-acetylglucosamine 4,6-dehydratase (inverting) [Candidatus Pelagibacter sp.]
MFDNKTIFITGGTGFFGKNFILRLFRSYKPKKVIIFSRDETKQYEIQNDIIFKKYLKNLRFFIGDVRDVDRLKLAMRNVDFVVHAAALKHVPSAEYNPTECIKTNISGAENVISAAIECNVKKVIALSTDKAANPINIYGATKLASDKLFIAANNLSGLYGPKFSVVRYGNVFASRGSVVPFFKKLLNDKSKFFPITDLKMTRFVISIDEAINLVFKSFKFMVAGEIIIPKIPSIKILDLARALDKNKKIKIVGIRPGEKLHEILCPADDSRLTLEFKNHYIIIPSTNFDVQKKKFKKNFNNEVGEFVKPNFSYESGNNPEFLNIKEIKKLLN